MTFKVLRACVLIASPALAQSASDIAAIRKARLEQNRALVIVDSVHVVDLLAREPMVVEHPDGTLFVSGYSDPSPKLWKSKDRGATWTRVNVGSEADGARGNSDVDLAVTPTGTLYFAQMGFDRSVGQGTHIAIGVSKDVGATWRWQMLSRTRFVDRPWVKIATDGTAHVIWNDTSGVAYAVSRDGGTTWEERPRIHDRGGSSHLAVGPNRQIAARIAPLAASGNKLDEGVDLIVVSTDGGATWQKRAAPGDRDWPSLKSKTPTTPRWVEPVAWDASGALYYFWTTRAGLWLARSRDSGATWTTWRLAEPKDLSYFPYLVARGKGELAATWFSGQGDAWRAHVAKIDVGDEGEPKMIEATLVPEIWGLTSRRENPQTRSAAGEYLPVTFLRDGSLAVVSPIQNERAGRYGFSWWRVVADTMPRLPSITLPPDLDRVLRDYERHWRARDAAGLSAIFTEDGFVPRPGGWVRGRNAIRRAYAQSGGDLRLRALAYAVADTVGYIVGAYAYGDAPSNRDNGKFVLALRRPRGGQWLIAADLDGSNRN